MSNNIKFQGFSFYINAPVEHTGTPKIRNTVNHFDLIADLVSLRRLSEESNIDFKQRIMDVAIHSSGGTYDGVINGITRELGYAREKAIQITLKLNSSGEPIARNPRVDILANKVILYSDYRAGGTQIIDKTIRIYKPEDTGFFLNDLVSQINSSQCFSASRYSGVRPNMHSTNLVQGDTDIYVQGDPIRTDTVTYLSAQHIVEESIVFDESDLFQTEVLGTPSAEGEYYIDRINGRIYTYSVPQGNLGVSYHASTFPFEVDYSFIKIYTFQDDNFQYELFNHETLDSGEIQNTLPNREGSEVYHQLFTETEVFWGK
jgi:hypothetical protein